MPWHTEPVRVQVHACICIVMLIQTPLNLLEVIFGCRWKGESHYLLNMTSCTELKSYSPCSVDPIPFCCCYHYMTCYILAQIDREGKGGKCGIQLGGKGMKEENKKELSVPKAEILTSGGSCSKGSLLTVI